MVKPLIMAATILLIHDVPEVIQYTCAILDNTMLAHYVLHNNKMLCYMEHALYRLEKTKIAFEHPWLIDSKLYQPMFNYSKFHAICYFV